MFPGVDIGFELMSVFPGSTFDDLTRPINHCQAVRYDYDDDNAFNNCAKCSTSIFDDANFSLVSVNYK